MLWHGPDMERHTVSEHEVRVFLALKSAGGWLTNLEVAERAKVAARTARLHTRRLVALGVLDVAEVFPGHRYRIAEKAGRRNAGYVQRLDDAITIMGKEGAR